MIKLSLNSNIKLLAFRFINFELTQFHIIKETFFSKTEVLEKRSKPFIDKLGRFDLSKKVKLIILYLLFYPIIESLIKKRLINH